MSFCCPSDQAVEQQALYQSIKSKRMQTTCDPSLLATNPPVDYHRFSPSYNQVNSYRAPLHLSQFSNRTAQQHRFEQIHSPLHQRNQRLKTSIREKRLQAERDAAFLKQRVKTLQREYRIQEERLSNIVQVINMHFP